jgi:predicted Fe-Mo cluster-binding NifX family protein
MILCIPVEKDLQDASPVYGHFGSAPYFLIHNIEKGTYESLANSNQHHTHGQCDPLGAIEGSGVGAVLCQGMGRKAVYKLNAGGVKVLVGAAATAREAIEAFKSGRLQELNPAMACGGHGHGHGSHGHGHGCHS